MSEFFKNTSDPLVSVIIPVHNGERYIEKSVRSVMAQTYGNWELLVIDDFSTDSTSDIVGALCEEDKRVSYIKNTENIGTAKTRNRGLELSKGDCVAFLDADDVWKPEKLETQLRKMESEKADLVYSSYEIVNENGEAIKAPYLVSETVNFEGLLKENVIGCSTVILSSEIAEKYRFVEDYYHEDYCLWLNILRDGYKVAGCRELLVEWRLITDSRSFDKRNSALYRWRIYREYLKLPLFKSIRLFFCYFIGGIKKYYT
ncbi:MAG: glycosyltransferase [Clostridia bacterium]|nr:glycosyltransferase [Clostridia bacterium]MBR6647400.1 glycosyltransferase [Clostridia bacterium]